MLIAAADRLGYKATEFWDAGIDEVSARRAWAQLMAWGDAHVPALLSVSKGGHWLVAYGADEQSVWVLDPNASRVRARLWPRQKFLRRRWLHREEGEGYYGIAITPAKPRPLQLSRRGGLPPSRLAFLEHNAGSGRDVLVLRTDLAEIIEQLPAGPGDVAAAAVFGSIRDPLHAALAYWSADVDPRWLRRRLALIEDLLRKLPYRVPAPAVDQFVVDSTVLCMADALIAAKVEPGEVDPADILAYADDAAAIFARTPGGEPASAFLARHEALLASRLSHGLAFGSLAQHRRHVSALIAHNADRRWAVSTGTERATLVNTAALLMVYAWYPR